LSVTPVDFFASAQRLATGSTFEMDRRNAISRVYYAAFHDCLLKLAPSGEVAPDIGHFDFCQHLLSQPPSSPRRKLGIALNHLRQQRNAADYTLNRDFAQTDVVTAFGAYDNVIRFLKGL
jgi:hypothetical protein